MNTHQLFEAKIFKIVNIFETDFPEYDNLLTFISLEASQIFFEIDLDTFSGK